MDLTFLNLVFPVLFALVGFPALSAAVVNLLKAIGWIQNNGAPNVVLAFNLLGFGVTFYLVATNQVGLLKLIDAQLNILASFVVAFTAFAVEIGPTKVFHTALRGIPWIGFSYTLKNKNK